MGGKRRENPSSLASELKDATAGDTSENFAAWSEPFLHCWSHVRISAIALGIDGKWLARAVSIVLVDAATIHFAPIATDRIWCSQWTLDISQLPKILLDIRRGAIDQERNPMNVEILLKDATGSIYNGSSGYTHDPAYRFHNLDRERAYRYEVEWRASTDLNSQFLPPRNAWQWLEDAERAFDALHQGTAAQVARRLEIVSAEERLQWDQKSFVRLHAPVPVALDTIEQSSDRSTLTVSLLRGSLIDSSKLTIGIEQTDNSHDDVQLQAGASGSHFHFNVPRAKRATLQITYAGQRIQREHFNVLPRLSVNPRLVALQSFEGGKKYYENGLAAELSPNSKSPEDAFERSVSHLLSLLGFSALWWGPHRKNPLPLPDSQADLLAFSADNSLILVVDCTVRASQDLKTAKLIGRARELERLLRDTCEEPPKVEPVLAIGIPSVEVPAILRQPSDGEEVTILAADHISAAMTALSKGCPHSEVADSLPSVIASGFSSMAHRRVWPDLI